MKRFLTVAFIAILFAVPFTPVLADAPAQKLMGKLHWRSIGPYIGGRVVAVAGVPSDPSLFYMGGVQGGIWKSNNYGQSWTNISDGKLPGIASSIGALAVAASNPQVIYAGTGEADVRGDFNTGDGIYKSTDAGATWHYAGLRDTHMTTSIVIDPHNPDVVYATSLGHVFKANAERGVFKSTDGGKSWKKVLFVDDNTGAAVVVMDQQDPKTLYATTWQVDRKPWALTNGGPGSALYKTTDGGAHWSKLSNNPGFAGAPFGKMGVSVSASNPNILYAIVQAHEGGVFRSSNGGATWKRVNSEWKLRQRGFYYMGIYVDPTNSNVVYAPQVDSLFRSQDGGKTFKPLTPPGDHHIVWINPRSPRIVVMGDDGGATVSVDHGKTWSTENNQPTGQYYKIAIDHQFPFHVYGAAQDEGAFEGPSASAEGLTLGVWHGVASGESTWVAPDPNNSNITYGSGYDSYMARLDTPTGDVQNVSPWPKYMSGSSSAAQKYRFGWTHPIFFSPAKPNELLIAAQYVFKSDDYGKTWTRISPDLTRDDKSTETNLGGPVDLDRTGVETFPDISALAVSPLSPDIMWAGSADGLVHVTTDGGGQWTGVTPPALPQWAQISTIEPSHTEKGTAYLSASRYQWDDFHPYLFKTADYGAHWTQITGGLPSNQYVLSVRQDPRESRLLFAGTRSTVYVSLDGGAAWQPLTLNLPGVQVRDLAIDARQGEVAAATHGRAFWILDDLKLLEQLAQHPEMNPSTVQLFAPETAWLTHSYGSPPFDIPNLGENPKYGTTVYFNVPKTYNGSTPVRLSFLDARGNTIRAFTLHKRDKRAKKPSATELAGMDHAQQIARGLQETTAIDPGMNAFNWDMRYAPAVEVAGFHMPTSDNIDDGVSGPTIVPGTYSAVLDYGATEHTQSFVVSLDPRFSPPAGALGERLALATRIHDTLDDLNRAINAARAARGHLSMERRRALDAVLAGAVQMNIRSSEGDLLHEVKLRDHLAFLMNELDTTYSAPTAAENETYQELQAQAASSITRLKELSAASPR
ncbi:MAG: WD40/YVTN/BNR-like repeat-containing protein [Candidatus Baltobacteraceae bacterium]